MERFIIVVVTKKTKDKNGNSILHLQLFENCVRFSNKDLKAIKSNTIFKIRQESLTVYPDNLGFFNQDLYKIFGKQVRTLYTI